MVRETSKEAYRKIVEQKLLPPLQQLVLDAVYNFGPCTANELVRDMKEAGKTTKGRDFFAQRLSELRDKGVIDELPKRECGVTGHSAYVWAYSGRMPVKFDKPKRQKCPTCNGHGYIETKQGKLF